MNIFCRFPSLFSKAFEKLGRFVSRHPKKIIVLSVISTILMSAGIIKIRIETDVASFIIPTNSRYYQEKRIVNHLFPVNTSSNWNLDRTTDLRSIMSVTVLPRNGDSVLKLPIFEEVISLDRMIRSFEIKWNGKIYNYSDLCIKTDGECYNNIVLGYKNLAKENAYASVKYPIDIDVQSMQFNITAVGFGGVTVGDANDIIEAKALRLLYVIDDNKDDKIVQKWKDEYLRRLHEQKSNEINVFSFSNSDFENQFMQQLVNSIKYGTIGILLLSTFSVLSSMTSDWETSKPLLALAGCASPALAVVASLGFIAVVDVPFSNINLFILLIITGIGVDDMFVLIAAWRNTDRQESVENRMGEAYSHAAVSVTMTTFTNFVTFLIGTILPLPATRNFCIQGSFAVLLDWVYQLSFFGACMALDGYREEKKLHPITFTPLVMAQDAVEKTWIYRLLFTKKSEDSGLKPPKLMVWFHDSLGRLMNQKQTKIFILLFFTVYVAGASWGLTTMKEGMNNKDVFMYGSDAYNVVDIYYQHFVKFNHPIQIIFDVNLDYSNRTVQRQMMQMMNRIQSSKYVSRLALNWLKHFLLFTRINRWHVSSYNLSDPKEFNICLREVFFKHPMGKIYRNDVVFNEDGIHISASRFISLPVGISEASKQKYLIEEVRSIADSLPYSPTTYCMFWSYYEIDFIVKQITLQTIAVAIASLFIMFSLFISKFSDVILCTICVISIQFGIVGYMAAFGVQLNFMTAVMVIVCVGFCVDSSAHMLNSYAMAKGNLEERIQQMYLTAGMPVFQGSFTTLLSISPLIIFPHYIFRVFGIITYLQITISFFHAILVLPTFLSVWATVAKSIRKSEKKVLPSESSVNSTRF